MSLAPLHVEHGMRHMQSCLVTVASSRRSSSRIVLCGGPLKPHTGWGESHGLPTVQLVPLHLLLQEEGAGAAVRVMQPSLSSMCDHVCYRVKLVVCSDGCPAHSIHNFKSAKDRVQGDLSLALVHA